MGNSVNAGTTDHTHRPAWLLGCVVLLAVAAYLASLSGGFLFDDFNNIVDNPLLRAIGTPAQDWLAVALSSGSGVLRRPLSMLSFGLNVAVFGMDPLAFKLVNLAIHIGNAVLLYLLGCRIAQRLLPRVGTAPVGLPQKLALLAAALWLLHPLNISGVAYIVQRMNELAMMFTLAGLLCYVDGRLASLRGESGLGKGIFGLFAFGVLAVLSKENGALVFAFALVIEAVCFRFEARDLRMRRALQGFFVLTVALPIVGFGLYLVFEPHWLTGSYASRDFTLYERILTEPRILWHYLAWIFLPNPAWMGLFHDDIAVSTRLTQPLSTLMAIAAWLAVIVAAWVLRRRSPGFTFAVAWFLIGHSMESTILPLELVFEHRNYLPMAGLLLGCACAVGPWLTCHLKPRAAAGLATALVLACAGLTAVRAADWGDPLRLALAEARHHPDSARSQYEAGRSLIIDGARKDARDAAETRAMPYLEHAVAIDPHGIHALVELVLIDTQRSQVDKTRVAELARRLRSARISHRVNPFLDMLVTASTQKPTLDAVDVAALVDAALANPRLSRKVRAMVMNNYGAYQFNVLQDRQTAVSLTAAAAAEDPVNPYFPLNLAKIATAMGQNERAMAYLVQAAKLDHANIYMDQIRQMHVALEGTHRAE
jgi:hypothetical protein